MNRNAKRLVVAALLVWLGTFRVHPATAQIERDSLAQTPPMGWNSWNKFACHVSED